MYSLSEGDLPIAEHLRLALEPLPTRHFSRATQYENVRTFLREHVERSGSYQLTRGDLRANFPFGNFESNEAGWFRIIADNLLDWDGYRFVISARLMEPPASPSELPGAL